ncbi:MAG: GNAT family N-acetyltransferase [Lachnotalea sp.]
MFKTIIIQIDRVHLRKCKQEHIIYELENMVKDLGKNHVKTYELDLSNRDMPSNTKKDSDKLLLENKINNLIANTDANVEECLIISELSAVIMTAKNLKIPCVGYDNPVIEKQDLYQANMVVEGFEEIDYKFLSDVYQRFYNLPIVVASTNRLIIREMVLEDLEELFYLYSNPQITKFIEPLYPYEEEVEFTKAYIRNMYGFYGYGLWSLIEKKTGRLIGRAGLNNREVDGIIQIELGYMIGVSYQRQGYAFEACNEILEFAFRQLECTSVNCFVAKENEASIALIKKIGFIYSKEVEIEGEKLLLFTQ